eukprot:5753618-Prorocentrum_lima.AAC.1
MQPDNSSLIITKDTVGLAYHGPTSLFDLTWSERVHRGRRDSLQSTATLLENRRRHDHTSNSKAVTDRDKQELHQNCLLYTSDAADDM